MSDAPPNRPPRQSSTVCCRIEFYQLYGLRGWSSKFGPPCPGFAESGESAPLASATVAVAVAECTQATVFVAPEDSAPLAAPGTPPTTPQPLR